jgi:ATP:corrinoid adenosyltransferase
LLRENIAAPVKIDGVLNMQGFVHVYTGDGKGKTTAAIGLAMRTAGAGMTSSSGSS